MSKSNQSKSWREKVHEIIYEADTPAGKLFDVLLLIVILISIVLVMLESVESIEAEYAAILNISEWVITILFSLEYILRIITVKKPKAISLVFMASSIYYRPFLNTFLYLFVGHAFFNRFKSLAIDASV